MQRYLIISACLAACVAGCQRRAGQSGDVLRSDDGEYVLTIVIDMSSSFQQLMAEDGKAWAFVCQVVDKYFRDRIGRSDKLILAQLSASDRTLLWQGTPLQLRQDFESASAFRDWLQSRADPDGSRIHEGIVQSVEYTLSDPIVAGGKGKSAVFILSDMVDTAPDGFRAQRLAADALAKVGKNHGVVGMYFVDVKLCHQWRHLLRDAGVPEGHAQVEADIVGRPTLPNFN